MDGLDFKNEIKNVDFAGWIVSWAFRYCIIFFQSTNPIPGNCDGSDENRRQGKQKICDLAGE